MGRAPPSTLSAPQFAGRRSTGPGSLPGRGGPEPAERVLSAFEPQPFLIQPAQQTSRRTGPPRQLDRERAIWRPGQQLRIADHGPGGPLVRAQRFDRRVGEHNAPLARIVRPLRGYIPSGGRAASVVSGPVSRFRGTTGRAGIGDRFRCVRRRRQSAERADAPNPAALGAGDQPSRFERRQRRDKGSRRHRERATRRPGRDRVAALAGAHRRP